MLLVDAHLDLAYNAINFGRNLQQPLSELRRRERNQSSNGIATVTVPELKRAGVGIVFGTIFTLPAHSRLATPNDLFAYRTQAEAHRFGMQQLDYYHRLADEDASIRLVQNRATLEAVVDSFQGEEENGRLLGIVPLMEGADPIREPEEVELWVERGLRLIGPAWDDTVYAAGAWQHARHGLTKAGHGLLEVMQSFNLILDITHMNDKGSLEALERYEGTAVATHSNCRALVPGERQLSDQQIRLLGERGGMIGIALYNPFLRADQRSGEPKERVTLRHVAAHIDHVCQLLGSAAHVGIGSDFDGGFGAKDIPHEMDSCFDLNLLPQQLKEMGYEQGAIEGIMGKNWISLLQRTLD